MAFWEQGYPDLPACSPRRGSIGSLVRPIFSVNNARHTRGAKPREADDVRTSRRSDILRLGSQERKFLCEPSPREVRMTQAMTTKSRRAPEGVVQHVSSLVLKRQAQARSPKQSTKGFHFRATRPSPPGRQDGGHRRAHCGVTTRSFVGEDHLLSG